MTDRTAENGFEHPTGVAPSPRVTSDGCGITIEAESLEACLRALAAHPAVRDRQIVSVIATQEPGKTALAHARYRERRAGVPVQRRDCVPATGEV